MQNAKSCEDKTNRVGERAAKSLESAADAFRAAGDESADAISGLANEAGEKLDSTATYVRAVAGGDLFGDLRHKVRRNPVGSLALAIAIGLAAGISWRASVRRS